VDLTAVTFMDASGVSALLAARRSLPAGARLTVACRAGPCRRLLELTRVTEVIPVVAERPRRG
jgi:anti-anti-sigma factor